jgi:GC-rich sequence DNA-binding factor
MNRLSLQLSQLTTSHASNTSALNSLATQREEVDRREKELRELVSKADEKRVWFNSFRDWLESVAAFLDEKVSLKRSFMVMTVLTELSSTLSAKSSSPNIYLC